jgi:hypothetical protein
MIPILEYCIMENLATLFQPQFFIQSYRMIWLQEQSVQSEIIKLSLAKGFGQ